MEECWDNSLRSEVRKHMYVLELWLTGLEELDLHLELRLAESGSLLKTSHVAL